MYSVISKDSLKKQAIQAVKDNVSRTQNPYPPGSVAHDLWYGYYTEEISGITTGAVVSIENIS